LLRKLNHRMLLSTPPNLETIVSHALPLTLVLSRSPAIYKCNFTSANLKVQFTTAIYNCNLQASLNHRANACFNKSLLLGFNFSLWGALWPLIVQLGWNWLLGVNLPLAVKKVPGVNFALGVK
jgi:hypothetical protein